MTAVPEIETERLLLRAHTAQDFPCMAELWSDPTSVQYTTGKPSTPEESWARLHRYAGHWLISGFGYWAWIDKATGLYVGEGGFADFKRAVDPALDAPEHGWALAAWARGRGYGREALAAQLIWAESFFKRRDFVCMIAPANERSIKLAQNVGYREYARTTYKGEPEILFRYA